MCQEAKEFKFVGVYKDIGKYAKELLKEWVMVCTVIGFPLEATTSETKAFETKNAIEHGADEVDMVINIGALKGP